MNINLKYKHFYFILVYVIVVATSIISGSIRGEYTKIEEYIIVSWIIIALISLFVQLVRLIADVVTGIIKSWNKPFKF